jgi:2Fe-2S ferredoxin
MARITIITRDGERMDVEGTLGLSVMEVIRSAGVDQLLALCGGCCSCATCHVHVDPSFLERLPVMEADEDDLLETSCDRDENSRLSCQLPFSKDLDGMTVTIAAED